MNIWRLKSVFSFLNNQNKSRTDPFKSDIYSVRLVFLFANLRKLPFEKEKEKIREREVGLDPLKTGEGLYDIEINDFIEQIVQNFEFNKEKFRYLLQGMLEYNPQNRLTLEKIKDIMEKLESPSKNEEQGMTEKKKVAHQN